MPYHGVTVQYLSGVRLTAVGSSTADGNGSFRRTFTVPNTAFIPSTNTVKAFTSSDEGGAYSATTTHVICNAAIFSLSPESGPSGSLITVIESGLPAISTVNLTIGEIAVSWEKIEQFSGTIYSKWIVGDTTDVDGALINRKIWVRSLAPGEYEVQLSTSKMYASMRCGDELNQFFTVTTK